MPCHPVIREGAAPNPGFDMHSSRIQLAIVAGLLILAGVGLTLYKATELGFPLLPGENRQVWTLESKITFSPGEGPVEVSLALPESQAGWRIIDENFASSGFGFSVQKQDDNRRALWTRRELNEKTTLYYNLQIYRADKTPLLNMPVNKVSAPDMPKRRQQVADRLAATLKEKSIDPASFTSLLLAEFVASKRNQEVTFLLSEHNNKVLPAVREILSVAGIPAQRIRGVYLEDGRRRQQISDLLEIYDGVQWLPYNPDTGEAGLPDNFFVWQRG